MRLVFNEAKECSPTKMKALESHLKDGNVVVLVHAHWCGHCRNFKPEWEKFAHSHSSGSPVIVAEIEESQLDTFHKKHPKLHEKIIGREGLGFPTVFIFKSGEKLDRYAGERTQKSLQKHIDKVFKGDETPKVNAHAHRPSSASAKKSGGAAASKKNRLSGAAVEKLERDLIKLISKHLR